MSVLKGLFRSSSRDSSPSGSPKHRKAQTTDTVSVETIQDDQAHNPFTELLLLSRHTNIVRHIVVIDQYSFATGGCDGTVIVWGVADGEVQQVLCGHKRPITCMCLLQHIAPNATECTVLLTAASDKTIIVWDLASGTQLHTLTNHTSTPRCIVCVGEEGEMFCSGGDKLYLWSSQCELIDTIDTLTEDDIDQLLPISETKIIAVIDRQLHVYRIDAESEDGQRLSLCRKLTPHREPITSIVKINATSFASGSMDGTIKLWSCKTLHAPIRELNAVKEYKGDDRLYPFSVHHMLLVQQRFLFATVGASIHVYDMITGSMVAERKQAHFSKINHLELVHDGYILVSCAEDGRIRLWGTRAWFKNSPDNSESRERQQLCDVRKLLGKRPEDMKSLDKPLDLDLLGECIAHSGAVQLVQDCGDGCLASCGVDGLVILWKDGMKEKIQRWQRLYNSFHGTLGGVV